MQDSQTHNSDEFNKNRDGANAQSAEDDVKSPAFLYIFLALLEKNRSGDSNLSPPEKEVLKNLQIASEKTRGLESLSFMKKYDKEKAMEVFSDILRNGGSTNTFSFLITAYLIMDEISKCVEVDGVEAMAIESGPPTDVDSSKNKTKDKRKSERKEHKHSRNGKQRDDVSSKSRRKGEVKAETKESKKKRHRSERSRNERKESKNKRPVEPSRKRKNRGDTESSEDSVEKARPLKKVKTNGQKIKKEKTVYHVLRDGCEIEPLFIKAGQKFTDFVPEDVKDSVSSVYAWSVETYTGDPKELKIFGKRILFTQCWLAVDVRIPHKPNVALKPLTKAQLKKYSETTDPKIENDFVDIVRWSGALNTPDGDNSDSVKSKGSHAKSLMKALKEKKYYSERKYYKIIRKAGEPEEASFWVRFTEQLPMKIKDGSPIKHDLFVEFGGKTYRKVDMSNITYECDTKSCVIPLPKYVNMTFKNEKKLLTSGPSEGFVAPYALYFDTEEEFEAMCAKLKAVSASLDDINLPNGTDTKSKTQSKKNTNDSPVKSPEKHQRGKDYHEDKVTDGGEEESDSSESAVSKRDHSDDSPESDSDD